MYTGITTDVTRRWREHSGVLKKGAKFFRGRKPKDLLYVESFENRSVASKKEYSIKRLSRKDKFFLIESEANQINDYKIIDK